MSDAHPQYGPSASDINADNDSDRNSILCGGRGVRGHQTEQALAAERRFQLVVEAAPSGMIMVDRAGTIVMVNDQADRMFGYSRDELLGQSIETLVLPRYRHGTGDTIPDCTRLYRGHRKPDRWAPAGSFMA